MKLDELKQILEGTEENISASLQARLRSERMKALLDIMQNELTEKQRACISAVLLENKTLKEYADELGVNKSTTHRTYWRGIERIRKHLKYIKLIPVDTD